MHRCLKTRQVRQTLWISLVNPPVNFLTTEMVNELFSVFKNAEKDDSVRVVVMTGGLNDTYIMHFSIPELARIGEDNRKAGLNLAARSRIALGAVSALMAANNRLMDISPAFEAVQMRLAGALKKQNATLHLWLSLHRLVRAVERFPKITVAAINGACNGGGTELSAAFDFRFMVGDQDFGLGQPEVLVGIIPGGGGTQRVTRLMGLPRALEWMLRGNLLTPEEAKDLGLLTDVFPKKEFTGKVQEFADQMAKRPPVAVDAVKKSVRAAQDVDIAKGLAVELVQSVRCFATRDTERALKDYIRLIRERVEVPDEERIDPEELFDIMQNARYTDDFKGR